MRRHSVHVNRLTLSVLLRDKASSSSSEIIFTRGDLVDNASISSRCFAISDQIGEIIVVRATLFELLFVSSDRKAEMSKVELRVDTVVLQRRFQTILENVIVRGATVIYRGEFRDGRSKERISSEQGLLMIIAAAATTSRFRRKGRFHGCCLSFQEMNVTSSFEKERNNYFDHLRRGCSQCVTWTVHFLLLKRSIGRMMSIHERN